MISICTFLWRDEQYGVYPSGRRAPVYEPRFVDVWARMLHAHLTVPHRFVVITDQPQYRFDPLVTAVPMWEWLSGQDAHWTPGAAACFRRLKLFDRDTALATVGERYLMIDLDVVATGNLDALVSFQEDFRILRYPGDYAAHPYTQGGLWGGTAGSRQHVFDWFEANPAFWIDATQGYVGGDQVYMAFAMPEAETAQWVSHRDGICLYHLIPPTKVPKFPGKKGRRGRLSIKKIEQPENAVLVFAHGAAKPWSRQMGYESLEPWFHDAWEKFDG